MPSYVGYTCKSIIDEHKDPKSLTVRTFINCTFFIIRLLNNYNTFRNNTVIHFFLFKQSVGLMLPMIGVDFTH